MVPNSKLTYQGVTEMRDRQGNKKPMLFFSFGRPGAYYYESLIISPETVYNLLEDGKQSFLTFTMDLTEDEISWLAAYDPAMGRGEKIDALLKQQQKNSTASEVFNQQNQGSDKERKPVWLHALGAHLLAEEAWMVSSGAPSTEELQKAWDDWMEKNPQPAPSSSKNPVGPA